MSEFLTYAFGTGQVKRFPRVIRGQRNALEVTVPKRPDATLTKEGSMFIFLIKRRYTNEIEQLTLTLQKPGVLQMQGVPFDKLRGEAVVVYADPLAGRLPAGPNLWLGPRGAI